MGSKLENAQEIEEPEDGPPPGFQSIITPQPPQQNFPSDKAEAGEESGGEEGPPPGFHPINPPPPSSDIKQTDNKDGLPPGWEFDTLPSTTAGMLAKPYFGKLLDDLYNELSHCQHSDVEMRGKQDVQDGGEGPQPDMEMRGRQDGFEDDVDGPPPGWEFRALSQALPSKPPSEPTLDTADMELGSREIEIKNGGKRPASVPSPQRLQPRTLPPPPPPPPVASSPSGQSTEKAQLVCGTCRKLLLYPRGAKWVQCPGCQEVNLVLEAHQIGQVNCGGCAVLLMHPHGAPAVQCSSCHFVTQIGAHNRRPSLSVQQAQRRRRANRGLR